MWKLLNEPEQHTPYIHQQHPHRNETRDQHNDHPHNRQNFMENWQTVCRSRQQIPQLYQNRHRDTQTRTNTRTTDNGWPVRPAQTTLDGYINTVTGTSNAITTVQQNVAWGDRDPNEQGPGPEPNPTT
jgi:hypothetical protein